MTMASYLIEDLGFSFDRSEGNYTSKIYRNVRLHISNRSMLLMEDLDKIYPYSKAFVFFSQHRSQSGTRALTCHFPGNYGLNRFGGKYRELAIAYPALQKEYMKTLITKREMMWDYQIVIESSHHGPTSLIKPAFFVEIGSTEIEWEDKKACSIICDSILEVTERNSTACGKVAICLGGTHYPAKFTKLLTDSEYSLAAIAAKYDLALIDKEMLDQMLAKSVEKVSALLIDWKGLGKEKERIMALAADTGLEIVRV
jgi:D-aminoacyl-tRNA deacylase